MEALRVFAITPFIFTRSSLPHSGYGCFDTLECPGCQTEAPAHIVTTSALRNSMVYVPLGAAMMYVLSLIVQGIFMLIGLSALLSLGRSRGKSLKGAFGWENLPSRRLSQERVFLQGGVLRG